jgi:hypothetical protein
MKTRKELLSDLKNNLSVEDYEAVRHLTDIGSKSKQLSELDQLGRKAELECLKTHNFDIPDYLKGKDLVKYMKLDNIERISFGMKMEWDEKFIELTRQGKEWPYDR